MKNLLKNLRIKEQLVFRITNQKNAHYRHQVLFIEIWRLDHIGTLGLKPIIVYEYLRGTNDDGSLSTWSSNPTPKIETTESDVRRLANKIIDAVDARFINVHQLHPEDLIRFLGAEEVVVCDHELMPISYHGYCKHKAFRSSDSGYYIDIYALSNQEAWKQLDKLNKDRDNLLYFDNEKDSMPLLDMKSNMTCIHDDTF